MYSRKGGFYSYICMCITEYSRGGERMREWMKEGRKEGRREIQKRRRRRRVDKLRNVF